MSGKQTYSDCPLCFETFSGSVIESHASTCLGKSATKSVVATNSSSTKSPQSKIDSTKKSTNNSPSTQKDGTNKKRPFTGNSGFFFGGKKRKEDDEEKESIDPEKSDEKIKKESSAFTTTTKAANSKPDRLRHVPLAEAMRPANLEEYFGQDEVAGKDGFWRSLIQTGKIPSMILWGPPGCGKTSLANVVASRCRSEPNKLRFVSLSACTSGVADVKEAVAKAKNELALFQRQTVLFIDEVHRFNKMQQDSFLPHVENGTLALIGATTENPSFSLNSALLSRCRVVVLNKLAPESIRRILERALASKKVFVRKNGSAEKSSNGVSIDEVAVEYLSTICDGDARTALNCLEIALSKHEAESTGGSSSIVDLDQIKSGLRRAHMLYDRKGDEHYHCASALQKSIRGSNDNAALYWTMRMLEGGEDPLFIARRFVRMASEDVGLGDPAAMNLAVSTMQGCQMIGRPECNVLLAQCAVYLARAKKSHEVYHAMDKVIQSIRNCEGNLPGIPLHLRNATTKLNKDLGYAKGYSYDLSQVQKLQYMPEGMEKVNFFESK